MLIIISFKSKQCRGHLLLRKKKKKNNNDGAFHNLSKSHSVQRSNINNKKQRMTQMLGSGDNGWHGLMHK